MLKEQQVVFTEVVMNVPSEEQFSTSTATRIHVRDVCHSLRNN